MSNLMDNIKILRESTGAGFLDCKKALEENNNEIEKFFKRKGKTLKRIQTNKCEIVLPKMCSQQENRFFLKTDVKKWNLHD